MNGGKLFRERPPFPDVHTHAALVQRFYEAFARRDAEAMAACYHPDVVFSDRVFGELRGDAARDMWRMLCAQGKDLVVEASGIAADDVAGGARWVATYSFGNARRRVTNRVRARFGFKDGLIVRHVDSFSLWRWSQMALGPSGALLGWTPMMQARIRKRALDGLARFRAAA